MKYIELFNKVMQLMLKSFVCFTYFKKYLIKIVSDAI